MSNITVREIDFQFSAPTQRYWLGGNPFKTHLLNSLTLFLPATEKWAIRVLKRSIKQVKNREVREEVLKLIAQEGQHANAHSLFWQNLRAQGYEIDRYIQAVNSILKWWESHWSNSLNIAIFAGFEHLTECIADFGLSSNFLAEAEPDLKLLFEWHAAEEIEHKSVVYNVLKDLNQSYLLRMVGAIVAHVYAIGLMAVGTWILLHHDSLSQPLCERRSFMRLVWSDLGEFLFIKDKFFFRASQNFCEYWRPNFHPSQTDNAALARTVTLRFMIDN